MSVLICGGWGWGTQIDFLHLKFVVDAGRLAYWLGKPVDVSQKSEKMPPNKLTHCKYFLYLCSFFLYTCVLKHFYEVNSRLGIHSLSPNDMCFSTCQRHWRLTGLFCVDTRMCAETTSLVPSVGTILPCTSFCCISWLDLWKSLNVVLWKVCTNTLMCTLIDLMHRHLTKF